MRYGRRQFLKTAAVAAGAWVCGARAQEPRRPNILLITSDQQHWQAFGAADPFFDTPNLDRLAHSGTVFRSAFCTTPQCSASRSSIYTGFYPHKTTVIGNIDSTGHLGEPIVGLPTHFETLGSRLGRAGYHTAYFGKWHLGRQDHFTSHFDVADLDGDAHGGATRKAISYLEGRALSPEKPFALCVNYINPHDIYGFRRLGSQEHIDPPLGPVPHPASWTEDFAGKPAPQRRFMTEDQGEYMLGKPDIFWERYREFYRDKCRLVDGQVGRVLDRLEALGLHENTIVVYVSDHGDMDTNHRLIYKGPFMYEHMVRVPLTIRVPQAIGGAAPQQLDGFALQLDILPTVCDFAGADAGPGDGQSLRGALTGSKAMPSREYVVSEYYNKQKWVNPIRMIRTAAFKYNHYLEHGEELYDLKNDPHELKNLAEDPGYRKQKEELAARLREWRAAQGDEAFDSYWPTHRDGTRYAPGAVSTPPAGRRRPVTRMRRSDTVT